MGWEDSKTAQCISAGQTIELRAHCTLQITFYNKNGHFYVLNVPTSVLKPSFSLKNTTNPWSLFLFGPTLPSPLQVHLRLQCQVSPERSWVLAPKREHPLPVRGADSECFLSLHIVIIPFTCNGYAAGWEEVQGTTESVQFRSHTTWFQLDFLPYTNWSSYLNTQHQFCQLWEYSSIQFLGLLWRWDDTWHLLNNCCHPWDEERQRWQAASREADKTTTYFER